MRLFGSKPAEQPNPFFKIGASVITFVKPDGRRIENVKAHIHSKGISIMDVSVPVEDGDVIERPMPDGRTMRFKVTNRGYNDALSGFLGIPPFPSHYEIKVENMPDLPAPANRSGDGADAAS